MNGGCKHKDSEEPHYVPKDEKPSNNGDQNPISKAVITYVCA